VLKSNAVPLAGFDGRKLVEKFGLARLRVQVR